MQLDNFVSERILGALSTENSQAGILKRRRSLPTRPLSDEQRQDTRCAVNITRATGEAIYRSPPEYHFPVGIGNRCSLQSAIRHCNNNVKVTLESSITTTGDRNPTLSTQNTFNLKNMFNDQLTKGKFVEILKQLGDFQLFEQFYQSQRLCLKTKGLSGQFLKMDVSKFQGLMKMKLNVHSDWDRWLPKLLKVTQDYALVLPLWIFTYERLFSGHKIRPSAWVKAWLETRMTTGSMTKDELCVWKLVQTRINEDSCDCHT